MNNLLRGSNQRVVSQILRNSSSSSDSMTNFPPILTDELFPASLPDSMRERLNHQMLDRYVDNLRENQRNGALNQDLLQPWETQLGNRSSSNHEVKSRDIAEENLENFLSEDMQKRKEREEFEKEMLRMRFNIDGNSLREFLAKHDLIAG